MSEDQRADTAHARDLVQQLLSPMPPGSYLARSDGVPTERAAAAHDNYAESGAVPDNLRSPDELRSFFDGLEFLEPGFGPVPRRHPGSGVADVPTIGAAATVPDAPRGGVARKP